MIHADEEVVTLWMYVENIAHACREAVYSKVHTTVKPFQRFPVGTQSSFRPRVSALDASAAQEAESHLAIYRQRIFASYIQRSANSCRSSTLVALILNIGKGRTGVISLEAKF